MKALKTGASLAIAAALMGGMTAPNSTAVSKNTVQRQEVQRRVATGKRKGHFPQSGGGRIKQGKYTGAKLRKIRKKQAEEAWKENKDYLESQGVSKDRLVDLW